jgi:DNA-binding GntR family transcriptional regulator
MGEWKPGDQLPSTTALAEQHGTSKATVSKVLRKLADEGLVVIEPQWGVFKA